MIVHVCQWELSPPDRFSVSAIDPVSREGELIYSIHSSLFFYLLHISTPSSTSTSSVVFRNVLMWPHFHFGEGLFFYFFFLRRPQAPCLTPLLLVDCIYELNIKICSLACTFLLSLFFTPPRRNFL